MLQSTYVAGADPEARAMPARRCRGRRERPARARVREHHELTSHRAVTSAGVLATAAPIARRGSHLAALRFHTVTSAPVPTRRPAIFAPMMPRPRKPTRGGDIAPGGGERRASARGGK